MAASGCATPETPADSKNLRMSRVTSKDGVVLAVEEAGPDDAPAIVFVHGLGISKEAWHRQIESRLASNYHLVAYDLRGHGQSTRPSDPAAYSDGARWGDDLDAVITATHAKSPVIVGWSLGGLILEEYLRDHGDKAIGGVVLVDAVTVFAPELLGKDNPQYISGLTLPDDEARRAATVKFVRACFATQPPEPEVQMILAAAGVLPASEHAAIQHMTTEGNEAALHALTRPALIVHGERDVLASPKMAEHTKANLPAAHLSMYATSGHAPFLEETARFDAELDAFVARVNSR